ncbi:MAG: nitrogenase component 1 [Candidatus Aquicultorales bacterium]
MKEKAYAVANPCKMCQPIGALFALKGMAETAILLHGSQGCATYMRRHMSGHFNEPVDVASSSLSEKEAVYGGEANLKQALRNVIKSYAPQAVAVITSCLAETIGDDVDRIVKEFIREERPGVRIVHVSTPSYSGTQAEGFNAAVLSIVEQLAVKTGHASGKTLVIPGNVSPADARYLKDLFCFMGIEYTLFPDISETLDAPLPECFRPIPEGGVRLDELAATGDALAVIQCGLSAAGSSASEYLESAFGVAGHLIGLPIGLGGTDGFLEALGKITGNPVPCRFVTERGRLLDAMVDAHKVLFGRKIAVYGEGDLVEALVKFVLELGMEPVVVATGGVDASFVERVDEIARRYGVQPSVLYQADFEEIHGAVRKAKPDLLLGNSDGAFIGEAEGVSLVRIGFPIHDRLGGQRRFMVGYEGAINILELMANELLAEERRTYRSDALTMYEQARSY